MKRLLCAVLLWSCGDDRATTVDAGLVFEAGLDAPADLFGEPCVQPAFPEIGICHMGEGACHDEAGGAVCRPFCEIGGQEQCARRMGIELVTDRGACVCVPP